MIRLGYAWYYEEYAPDMKSIGKIKTNDSFTEWYFSQLHFAKFINDLEDKTSWKYSDDIELLLFNPIMDFTSVITINISKMENDNVIRYFPELFETLIKYYKTLNKNTLWTFSEFEKGKTVGTSILNDLLNKWIKPLNNAFKISRYYAIKDISKI